MPLSYTGTNRSPHHLDSGLGNARVVTVENCAETVPVASSTPRLQFAPCRLEHDLGCQGSTLENASVQTAFQTFWTKRITILEKYNPITQLQNPNDWHEQGNGVQSESTHQIVWRNVLHRMIHLYVMSLSPGDGDSRLNPSLKDMLRPRPRKPMTKSMS
jgi:hypothetical protein